MNELNKYMRISELSKRSEVPISKIRYYILKGIIPKPIKTTKTSAYYSHEHLKALNSLKKFHSQKVVSVAHIKKMLNSLNEINIKGDEQINYTQGSQIVHDKILQSSIPIFRKKGYERATVTDIASSAGISRNTFYQHFENKKQLFTESLNRIFFEVRKQAPPPDDETPISTIFKKMFLAFYEAYPEWSDMMNMFRASATKYPAAFSDLLEESLNIRISPIANDVKRAIKSGTFRELNSELVGIMLAGLADYLCYYLHHGKFGQNPSEIIDQSIDILVHGLERN